MKFSDMVTLAKAGYKVSDIKELLSMATDEPTEPKDVTEPKPTEPEPEPTEPGDGEPTEPTEPAEPEPDYKKLYEDTQKALKEAQAANRKGDHADVEKTPEQIAIEHFNSILR